MYNITMNNMISSEDKTNSKIYLYEGLLKLLQRKSFKKITVNDICQQAGVSRSTFYLHFDNKYQLLKYVLNHFRTQAAAQLKGCSVEEILTTFFTCIKDNEAFFHNLFIADLTQDLLDFFDQMFINLISEKLMIHQNKGYDIPYHYEVFAIFYSSGFSASTVWWIKNNYVVSIENMVDSQIKLLNTLFKAN